MFLAEAASAAGGLCNSYQIPVVIPAVVSGSVEVKQERQGRGDARKGQII